MLTKMPIKHKSADWQWKRQLQSCYSTFLNTNTTYSKNLMKRWCCLLFTVCAAMLLWCQMCLSQQTWATQILLEFPSTMDCTIGPHRYGTHLHHVGSPWTLTFQGGLEPFPGPHGANNFHLHTAIWSDVHEVIVNCGLGCSKSIRPH